MNTLNDEEKQHLFATLGEIKSQQHKTNQALFGDETIGLTGVVKDLNALKHWRNEVTMKTSYVAGVVAVISTAAVITGKAVITALFGKD